MATTPPPTLQKGESVGKLLTGHLCMLICTIFFGVDFPLIKMIVPSSMNGMDVTVFRIMGACILFWLTSAFIRCKPLQKQDYLKVLLGGGLSLFAFLFLFNLSLQYGNPVDVSIVMTLPPIIVVIIGVCFMHARVSLLEVIGLAVGLAGAVIVILGGGSAGKSGSDNLLGDLIALASCFAFAIYLIIMAKPSHDYSPVSVLRWTFLAASVPCLFLLDQFFRAPIFHAPDQGTAWIIISVIMVAPSFLSYLLMSPAIKLIGSELTGLYQYFLPVIAVVSSLIFGVVHEVRADQIIAMVIVVVGMVLTTIGKRRSNLKAQKKAAVGATAAKK